MKRVVRVKDIIKNVHTAAAASSSWSWRVMRMGERWRVKKSDMEWSFELGEKINIFRLEKYASESR